MTNFFIPSTFGTNVATMLFYNIMLVNDVSARFYWFNHRFKVNKQQKIFYKKFAF